MPEQEDRNPPIQEEEEGAPPEQRAIPVHGMQGRGRTPNPKTASRGPSEQCAPPTHGMQGQGREGAGNIQPEGKGGPPPNQARTPFLRGLIQEMGGKPQDLRSPPPPTQDEARGRG